jgi:hypothetical protein
MQHAVPGHQTEMLVVARRVCVSVKLPQWQSQGSLHVGACGRQLLVACSCQSVQWSGYAAATLLS